MEIEGKLSRHQTAFLIYGSAAGNIVVTFTEVTSICGRSFWVAVLIGVLLEIPFALWILLLGSYQQGGTVFDLLEDGLGKAVSKSVALIYILLNIALSVCLLNWFTGTIKVFFLPRTPSYIIILLLVIMCAVFANGGIKYLGRFAVLLCVLYTLNYFVGFSFSFFKAVKMENITPVFDTSMPQFLKGVLVTAGNDAECLLFLMVLVQNIPQTRKHYAAVIKGLFSWAIVLTTAILIMEGIVSQEILSKIAQAGITVSSDIQIGSFFSGLEVFILITYQYLVILKVTILLYSCWEGGKKLFKVPRGRPLLILSAILILVASVWMNSYNEGYYYAIFFGNYVIPPFVIIVLLLGTISVLIKKHREGSNAK